MNAARRRNAPDERALYWFIAVSLAAHLAVFVGGRIFKPREQRVMPVYNVTLVTSLPGGGKRAEAPSAKGDPAGKAAAAPKAAEPAQAAAKPAEKPAAKKEAAPAPKPAPVKQETRPVPKDVAKKADKKADKKSDAKADAKASGKSTAAAKASARDAKAAEQDLGSALDAVKGLIKDKQRGSQTGMEGGRRTEVGEFGAGQGGAQVGALALQIYMGQVQNAIQANWRIPGELARLNIAVQLGLRVGPEGKVLDVWVDEGSGVGIFDESAKRAVRAASPLPVPPQTKNGYFEFYTRFTPQGARSQ